MRSSTDLQIALSSALGSAMFSTAAADSEWSGYSKKIDDLVLVIEAKAVVSEGDIVVFHNAARDLASQAAMGSEQRVKRQVKIRVSGRDIQLEVSASFYINLCST